jgi:hypothetical protein
LSGKNIKLCLSGNEYRVMIKIGKYAAAWKNLANLGGFPVVTGFFCGLRGS